jgi:cysteinyl-tRNA synthetase
MRLKRKNLSSADIDRLVAERQEARAAKDFAKSDALRDQLHNMGVEIRDTPQGVIWDLL